jgi:hypothetical protein
MRNLGLMDPAFLGGLGGGILWTPAQISTALWLDAADSSTITTVSGGVSQWDDKSGNNRHSTQAVVVNRPAYTANGLANKNVVTFHAASSTRLLSTLSAVSLIESAFLVANVSSANTGIQTLLASSATGGRQFRVSSTTASFLAQASSLLGASSVNAPKDTATVFNLQYTNGGLSSSFFFNGSPAGTSSAGNAVSGAGNTAIGAQGGGGEALTGYIAEIVVLQFLPSTATRQQLEGYLAHKWGLTANLPSDHPFKVSPPYV